MNKQVRCFTRPSTPILIGVFAFLFYALTGSRTIQWQDSAQFTYRVCSGTLWNEYGLAMVHPLHFWVGRFMLWVFPGPDPWAVSLVSALGGALSVGLVCAAVVRMTHKMRAGMFAGMTLMLAHSFWRFSGLPEVYTLSAALLLGEVILYLKLQKTGSPFAWWGLFFLNGLGLANHNLALLSLSVWGITFLLWCREEGKRLLHLVPMGLLWLLGAFPYLLIAGLELQQRPVGEVIHSALFGEGFKDQVTGLFPAAGILLISIGFMGLSFPTLALPLALRAGWKRLRGTKGLPLPVLCITVMHLLFFLRYNVIDQYTFLIPVYGLIALLAGVGFAGIQQKVWQRLAWGLLLLQPMMYAMTPGLIRRSGVMQGYERHKPYRDDYDYLFQPWQVMETSAEKLMSEAFAVLGGEGDLVVADDMAVYTAGWMRMHLGLEEKVRILRPAELGEKVPEPGTVWVPDRDDLPPPPGWRKEGEIWVVDEDE